MMAKTGEGREEIEATQRPREGEGEGRRERKEGEGEREERTAVIFAFVREKSHQLIIKTPSTDLMLANENAAPWVC